MSPTRRHVHDGGRSGGGTKPLFEQVKARVVAGIRKGRFRLGDVLPSTEELAEEAGCSAGTVRRALDELAQAGVVRRVQRRGTVVVRKPGAGRVCLLLSPDAHTNLLFQDPIYGALSEAGYEVDMVPTAALDVTEVLARGERLRRGPDPADVIVVIEPGPRDGEEEAVYRRMLGLFERRVVYSFGQDVPFPDVARVAPDQQVAARELVKHLVKLGHRRVGMFAGSGPSERSWASESARCARDMLDVAGAVGVPCYSCEAQDVVDFVRRGKLTAFWCVNDHAAVLAVNACHREGLRVPDDVSIAGRYDTPWGLECTPRLTSISLDPEATARAVVRVIPRAGEPVPAEPVLIRPTLIVRESTGPAPG